MSARIHSFPPGKFIGLTDLDQVLHEARPYVSFRGVKPQIHDLLEKLAPDAGDIFADLPAGTPIGELHSDSFQVLRAQRLHSGYSVEFTGTGRERLTSATGMYVASGVLEVHSTGPERSGRLVRRFSAGETVVLEDNETHRILAREGAEILQVVTPRRHWGRTLCLPAESSGSRPPIAERFNASRAALRGLAKSDSEGTSPIQAAARQLGYTAFALYEMTHAPRKPRVRANPPRRVMFVHAHPDDESSKGAATVAELVRQGHEVMIVTCTGGEAGSVLNPAMEHVSLAELPTIRAGEMAAAMGHLGAQHHRWLGYLDSGMPEDSQFAPDSFAARVPEATADLTGLIREFKPEVLVTYDETGGYPHPDHIATHQVSVAAVDAAADPDQYPERGEPWQVRKLYYHRPWERSAVWRMHLALRLRGRESPLGQVLRDWRLHPEQNPGRLVTTEVWPHYESVLAGRRALLEHRTQVDPHAAAVVPSFMVGPDKYQRVRPAPRPGERVETSLVAGLSGGPARRGPRSGRRDRFARRST